MTERRNRNCSQHSGKDFVFYEISSNNNMPPRAHVLRIITKFPPNVSRQMSRQPSHEHLSSAHPSSSSAFCFFSLLARVSPPVCCSTDQPPVLKLALPRPCLCLRLYNPRLGREGVPQKLMTS